MKRGNFKFRHVILLGGVVIGLCTTFNIANAAVGLGGPIRAINASSTERAREIKDNTREAIRDLKHSSSTATTTRGLVKERNEALREVKNDRRDSIKEKVLKHRIEIAKAFANRMIKRFEVAIERLSKLSDRIASRSAKVKALGKDTSAVDSALLSAKTSLDTAKGEVATMKTIVSGIDASSTQQSIMDSMKQSAKSAQDDIVNAHKSLNDAFKVLKGLASTTQSESESH